MEAVAVAGMLSSTGLLRIEVRASCACGRASTKPNGNSESRLTAGSRQKRSRSGLHFHAWGLFVRALPTFKQLEE